MPIKDILLAITVAAIWGFNFIFVKLGTHEIPPIFLCAIRFFFASIPAIFFVRFPAASFKIVALYGLVMFGLQFSLIFTGIAVGMTAGMASLILQTQIFFSIFFAVVYLNERPTLVQILGALVAFSGIATVAFHLDANVTAVGFLLVIAGAATWGIGNLITKKIGRVNMLALIVWGSLITCLPLLLASFLIEGQEKIVYSMHHFTWVAVVSLFYIVYISTWAGYGIWGWLISRYNVSTVVPFTLLVPIFGIASSMLVLGEHFEAWKIGASALVIAGLCINIFGTKLLGRRNKEI